MDIQRIKQQSYLLIPLIFLAISITWSFYSNYTWDDDAVSRYFNTTNAGTTPVYFLDSWNRPLFVILFYLPIHFFGKMGLVVCMTLLTAASGILLYKGMRLNGNANAYAVIFFLIFQTFLFGISRDAMTEPLASFFFSLGIYLYYKKSYAWFAIVGSLLPLARTETILLLPFWAYVLLEKKKLFLIPLLGAGLLAWFIGWFAFTGNINAFFNELLKTGETANRYGHTKITHQFSKYVYVLGPVIFFYFLLGYLTTIKNIFKDHFIMLQFTAGFVMYVIFSSTLDIGQSGGALRNLITISPLAAIIALYGFNYWMGIFGIGKPEVVQANTAVSAKKKTDKKQVKQSDPTVFRKTIIFVFIFFLLLLGAQLLRDKLLFRQQFSEDETDNTILFFLIACSALILVSFLGIFKKHYGIIIGLLFLLQAGFTLYYESPDSHGNDERLAMNKTVDWLTKAKLDKKKIYCNHPWFFWAAKANSLDKDHYGRIDSSSLSTMKAGSIVIWEGHYTNKNNTNIPVERIMNDPSMSAIYYVTDEEGQTRCMIFAKLGSTKEGSDLYEQLVRNCPDDKYVSYLKGFFERKNLQNMDASTKSFSRALELDPAYSAALYQRGVNYMMQNDKQKACADMKSANSMGNLDANKLLPQVCN